jgi:hypothetical protein
VPEPLGIGDHLDPGDPFAGDGEAERPEQPSRREDGQAHGPVYQRQMDEPGTAGVAEREGAHGPGTVHRRAGRQPGAVVTEHDLGVEHGHERVEVAVPQRGQERVDDPPLAGQVDLPGRSHALDPTAGPAGQLPGRDGGAFQDGSDVVEGHGEDVVQDEGEAFGGGQDVEHDHQRRTDRVGEQHRRLGVVDVVLTRRRLGHGVGQRLLPAPPAGAQHLEALPADDGGQPSGQVLDPRGVGRAEPQPRVLHRVVGLRLRPEHPVGDRPQASPLLLEPRGQPVSLVHRSHCPASVVHSRSEPPPRPDVTASYSAFRATPRIRGATGQRKASGGNRKPRQLSMVKI